MAYNYYNPQNSPLTQFQSQQVFPQPSGNVYYINNSMEVANVPIGMGASVAVCLPENILYIKTLQNGMPLLAGYKLSPLDEQENRTENKIEVTKEEKPIINYEDDFNKINEKISSLESKIKQLNSKIGGNEKWEF